MNPIRRFTLGVWSGVKAAAAGTGSFVMQWAGRASSWGGVMLPRTRFDYQREIGNGSGSSAVMACINWITRTFPEAPLTYWRINPDDTRDPVRDHPMIMLIKRPNPSYSGLLLWSATLQDFNITGNAYWLKVRGARRAVTELWYAPSWTMTPKWPDDGSAYISHYEYRPNSNAEPIDVAPEDVVHFRYGIDPANVRKGLSPLASVYREIFTDDEAANYTASLLRNMGVPGLVIAPDSDVPMTKMQAEEAKSRIEERFSGDNRGRPLLMSGKTKVTLLSFNPEQMQLRTTRSIPEERISGVIGIPAIVAGLGAGLDRSTFSNTKQAREAAYESNLIPTQRLLAAEVDTQLYQVDFETGEPYEIGFDLSDVRELQEDQDALYKRLSGAVEAGWMLVSEARSEAGLSVDSSHEYFLIPANLVPTAPDAVLAPAAPAPLALPPGQPPLTPAEAQAATVLRGFRELRLRAKAKVVEITDADLDAAEAAWDAMVDEPYDGLLSATAE